ncbi:adenine deaminase [Longibacter salinarum]|uniref:Adenine deaminase n=1 Tax=Longibacter salinarum TaxID=1850348 RepID=A0A2A8CXJ4_9BACT|nr:adenine deaminase [Longibacter salinarum]PEN13459.1 adenine deaminase [Longibacter salinarum]
MSESFSLAGRIVDLHERDIRPGVVHVVDGRIDRIELVEQDVPDRYLLPGFVDAHVHVESSMLTPSEFARVAVMHGTVATVSDPHEIANVLGVDGVEYMIADGTDVPCTFAFGAPSCVPATPFETAGAELDAEAVDALLARADVPYLSEVMNYPGVIDHDNELMAKIDAARRRQKPVDGHAPGLRGHGVEAYASAGVQTDHECVTIEEAREKLAAGMKILIREGSAAKNFDALIPLMDEAPDQLMFCSDDKHPDALVEGHIDDLVRRAIQAGYDRYDVLRAACVNPVEHYGLNVGLLREGDRADMIVVSDLESFEVKDSYVGGVHVASGGETFIPRKTSPVVNRFGASPVEPSAFRIEAPGATRPTVRVIDAVDNQLVTSEAHIDASVRDGEIVADPERDVLKIAVVNRYHDADPAVALIRGFGLSEGAIASSVAHDSHNIVAVGSNDEQLAEAVNAVIETKGGIAAVGRGTTRLLPLPIAGLISDRPYDEVARRYTALSRFVQEDLDSPMDAPFMTLSFMALLVIPKLKLSDKGLFDGESFEFVGLRIGDLR